MLGRVAGWWQSAESRLGARAFPALCLLGVLVVASFVRLDGLGNPRVFIADEGFYAPDGCVYVSAGHCGRASEATPEHPPLGKWLIGAGIKLYGFTPVGWRIAPAIAGILTVGLLFLLALQETKSLPNDFTGSLISP